MRLPKIPAKGSHQWKMASSLAQNANDHLLKHVWVLTIKGLTHTQITNAVEKLREKGWPIEDTPVEEGAQHGYRMDFERWVAIREKISIKLGIS